MGTLEPLGPQFESLLFSLPASDLYQGTRLTLSPTAELTVLVNRRGEHRLGQLRVGLQPAQACRMLYQSPPMRVLKEELVNLESRISASSGAHQEAQMEHLRPGAKE